MIISKKQTLFIPKPEDALHKAVIQRLLINLLDDREVASKILFKGGTCAGMLGWLDRFSLDLDFDLRKKAQKELLRKKLAKIFQRLGLTIKEEAKETLFYVLKYQAPKEKRNTLKLSIVEDPPKANLYEAFYLPQIDRFAKCQTKETMFANKLVAVIERYEKHNAIAGRDIYDIHYFFSQGTRYNKKVVEERRNLGVKEYLEQLIGFMKEKITEKIISQDLNYLLSPERFAQIRKTLKIEVLSFLEDEIGRLALE